MTLLLVLVVAFVDFVGMLVSKHELTWVSLSEDDKWPRSELHMGQDTVGEEGMKSKENADFFAFAVDGAAAVGMEEVVVEIDSEEDACFLLDDDDVFVDRLSFFILGGISIGDSWEVVIYFGVQIWVS